MTEPRVRCPIVGGNWKMNTDLPAAINLAETLVRELGAASSTEVVLFPPFPNLEAVHRIVEGSNLELGAQDMYWEDAGAYTGEVSGSMLCAVGCGWIIAGHSERRRLLGEDNDVVNRKVRAALRHNLRVILAIGETRDERFANRAEEICDSQLCGSLDGIEAGQMEHIVIAYEPVWAIGTGETATPDQAREAHGFVRTVLARLYGEGTAQATRIQYGGSVTAANADELMAQPGIDGALVGGASLKPADFTAIVHACN